MWKTARWIGLAVVVASGCSFDSAGGSGGDSSSGTDTDSTGTTDDGPTTNDPTSSPTMGPTSAPTGSSSMTATTEGPTSTGTTETETNEDTTTGPVVGGCPDDSDLVACYTFEDRGADGEQLVDGSSNALHGAAQGVDYIAGPFGDALDHGNTGAVTIPEDPLLDLTGAMTVELWMNPASFNNTLNLVENDIQYRLLVTSQALVMCRTPQEQVVSLEPLEAGEWAHVACRYDQGTADLFIHGELIATAIWGAIPTEGTRGTSIGNALPNFDVPFAGQLDTVRLWSRALTDAEIAAEAALID